MFLFNSFFLVSNLNFSLFLPFLIFPPFLPPTADEKQKNSSKTSMHDFILSTLPTIWQHTNNSNKYILQVVLFPPPTPKPSLQVWHDFGPA